MKHALFATAALALASVFGGTGVTQRELTNAVNEVKAEMTGYTDAEVGSVRDEMRGEFLVITNGGAVVSYPAMTNYVKEATQSLTNLTAYVRHEDMSNAVNAAKTELRGDISTGDTQVADTAQNNLTNAVGHIMDFIEADVQESEPVINADGSITIVHIDYSLGYPRRVKIRLIPRTEQVYADKLGLRVVSSSYSGVTEGMLFACTGTGSNFYNVAFGTISWEKSNGYYHFYGSKSPNLVLDSSAPYYQDFNQIVVYRGSASMSNLVGSFTVEPYRLTDEEFEQVAGNAVAAEHNEWSERSADRLLGYRFSFQQIDNLSSAKKSPVLKAVELPIFPIPSYPNAPKYHWEDDHPLPDDEHYWEPEDWYKAEDWNDPYAWVAFPQQVSIPYTYNGQTYTKVMTVTSIAQLTKYFVVTIPPRSYSAPEMKEKKNYCKSGQHIYVNCKCSRPGCNATRSHQYDPCGAYDSHCAKCKLYNTKVKQGPHGELIPDGDTDTRCTHICDEPTVAYHTGWHHTPYGEDDIFNCSCLCGVFGSALNKAKLAHNYTDEDDITTWHDTHDGQTHWGIVRCQRGNCQHEKTIYKDHEVEVEYDEETGEPTNVFPYNDDAHVIKGDCTKCTAVNLDHHLEQHHMIGVDEGETVELPDGSTFVADEPFCYCNVCLDSTYHDSTRDGLHDIFTLNCGRIMNCIIGCARCGKLIAHNEHDFISENNYDNDLYHRCVCGLHEHKHKINETSEKCEGGYHWYAEYDEYGREIGGDWVEVDSWVDDGCEHDWHEDPEGTGDIPCWCGRGKGKRFHVFCGEIRRGKQPPFQSINDDCPVNPDPPPDPGPDVGGGYVIEWDDEITIKWHRIQSGVAFLTGLYPYPVQWGTKHFSGDSNYKPKSFRVMRYATWVDWWHDL